MLLEWKDAYRTGVEEVDYEHRELIDLINHLHDRSRDPDAPLAVPAFFGDLNRAIAAHFALEERQMREHRYEQLAEHKADHERLLDEIREIMDAYEVLPEAEGTRLLGRVLGDWFGIHFRTHDPRLHKALGPHAHE